MWIPKKQGSQVDPNSHTHSNKIILDALGDSGGKLTYNGSQVDTTSSGGGTYVDKLNGKVIGMIGSSSMQKGDGTEPGAPKKFWQYIQDRTGFMDNCKAKGGTLLTSTSNPTAPENDTNSQFNQLSSLPSTGIDMIVCQLLANDDNTSASLGTWTDTTAATVYGALHMFAQRLYAKYPTQPIGWMSSQYRGNQTAETSAYQDALERVAAYYGIPFINLSKNGRTPYNISSWKSVYVVDPPYHLGNAGNLILSYSAESFFRKLIGG
jgi:hypothetical protein